MTSFKAVFTDMDGTLLGPDHKVTEFTKEVLKKLRAKNIPLILATGRPYPAVFQSIDASGLEPDYIISTNGGRIHDHERKIISRHNLDPAVVMDLAKLRHQPREDGSVDDRCPMKVFSSNFYAEEHWYTDNAEIIKVIEEIFFHNSLRSTSVDFNTCSSSTFDNVHEMFFMGKPADILAMKRYIETKHAQTLQVMISQPDIIDVVGASVDKGSALREICAMKGFKLEEVVAFGDSMNDEPMLKVVPNSFVMGNALPVLREALPNKEVILSNKEDGVAKKLIELFNL